MGEPFVGEIRMFGGSFAPAGWAMCQGQSMPISENETLFNLIGTTYGGDGQETFALPDLRGRLPIHVGNGFVQAETGGAEEVTLTVQQIPAHGHSFLATSSNSNDANAANNVAAQATAGFPYLNAAPPLAMAAQSIGSTGGSQPHSNFQPYLCIDFIISLFGVFPHQ